MSSVGTASFRPAFGRWLTIGFAVVCLLAAMASLATDGLRSILSLWPWLALLTGSCWALFWRPVVSVDDQGVELVNVWHTVAVPWDALVGLETKWALTLVTIDHRYRAWAAPAPGRSVMRAEQRNTHRLRDAAIGGEIRPGDLPETDSGAAAVIVRHQWKRHLETAVELVDGAAVPRPTVSIHWYQAAVAVGLAAVAVVGLL